MQLFLRVSQYYILRGNVPFPRAGHISINNRRLFVVVYKLVNVVLTLEWYCVPVYQVS